MGQNIEENADSNDDWLEMRKLGELMFFICTGEKVEERSLEDQIDKYLEDHKSDKLQDKLIKKHD